MIRVRNMKTNETMELDPKHPVLIAKSYIPTLDTAGIGRYETDGRAQACKPKDATDAVTALSWSVDFPKDTAFVRTEEPYNESTEPHMVRVYGNTCVWVRCSLRLL